MKYSGPCMAHSPFPINLPNILTLARIGLIPVFVLVYIFADVLYWVAALLFALAAFTDWLDGYLARRLGQTTPFGAFLDPVADKLIVVTALVLLIGKHANIALTLAGVVIIGREIVVSALREWMAEMNRRGLIAVSWLGKAKTTLQMVAIVVLLANQPQIDRPWVIVGMVLLYIAALMTLWSMAAYLRAAWPTLLDGFKEQNTGSPESVVSNEAQSEGDRAPES